MRGTTVLLNIKQNSFSGKNFAKSKEVIPQPSQLLHNLKITVGVTIVQSASAGKNVQKELSQSDDVGVFNTTLVTKGRTRILVGFYKEGNASICDNMDEPRGCEAICLFI